MSDVSGMGRVGEPDVQVPVPHIPAGTHVIAVSIQGPVC